MSRSIPYPPPPEPGWYDDDTMQGHSSGVNTGGADESGASVASAEPANGKVANAANAVNAVNAVNTDTSASTSAGVYGDADWDGTVLSSSFIDRRPIHRYVLRNDSTGQTVILDHSALLGRKPTKAVPEGVLPQKLDDPTRTISRNHAAVSFDREGRLWIEDYRSLNGTYLIVNGEEIPVKERPVRVTVPCTVRIGDQFFNLEEG